MQGKILMTMLTTRTWMRTWWTKMKMNACEEYNMYIYKITTMTKVSFYYNSVKNYEYFLKNDQYVKKK